MKILKVSTVSYFQFEVEGHDWDTFRRSTNFCNWEVLMGQSWEPLYSDGELEEAFQEWKRANPFAYGLL